MKNNFIKLAGVLFIIGAVSAGLLAWLNDVTKDRIEYNDAMASMDPAVLDAVVPGAVVFDDYEDADLIETIIAENSQIIDIMTAVDASGNEIGRVVRTFSTVRGYGGDIELYVGFTPEGEISGSSVISHDETEGLGSKVSEPDFIQQFTGRDGSDSISESAYDAVSGATYSSKAFLSAINNAIEVYKEYLK